MKHVLGQLKKCLFCFLLVYALTSCNKSSENTQQVKTASLDFSKLISNNWLTLHSDTSHCCVIRYQILYRDQIITTDSTQLNFQSDSSWIKSITSHAITNYSTTSYTGFADCDYLPRGNSYGTGNFSFNAIDSTITITSGLLNIVDYEVLLLTNDTLKTWNSTEGTITYVSF